MTHGAMARNAAKSVWTMVAMFGRCTFNTTACPVVRVARTVWPREAAANGSNSTWAKWVVKSGYSRRRMVSRSAALMAGTSSCNPCNSWVISGGSTSTRALRNCPSLMSTPPIWMARWRKFRAIWRNRRGRLRRMAWPTKGMRPRVISTKASWRIMAAKKRTMRQ